MIIATQFENIFRSMQKRCSFYATVAIEFSWEIVAQDLLAVIIPVWPQPVSQMGSQQRISKPVLFRKSASSEEVWFLDGPPSWYLIDTVSTFRQQDSGASRRLPCWP